MKVSSKAQASAAFMRILLILMVGPLVVISTVSAGVSVEIFEDLTKGNEFDISDREPVTTYQEPAFAFPQLPKKYSPNALPLDRSSPFLLRATYIRAFEPGPVEFRLRSKGAAQFLIDGVVVASTKPQKKNTSSHDELPPPLKPTGSALRAAPYPHQEVVISHLLDDQPHEYVLLALIGGDGLVPSPSELSISAGRPGEVPQLLGPDNAPPLTDAAWDRYVEEAARRHTADDRRRRRELSAPVALAWKEYHDEVRRWIEENQPPVPLPSILSTTPALNAIDHFIGAKLERLNRPVTASLSDTEFLRRLSLDLAGVIPTQEDVFVFFSDPIETRRARAIERLLHDASWADHWVSYWQDVLAENPGILKPDLNNSGPFRWWLHQSFEDNIPFDRLVCELIEMEGSVYEGAPAAFKLATLNDAPTAAKADILSQAFLGERLSCARCHDAPHHPHKQEDTFALAAMLSGEPVKLPKSSTVPVVEGGRKPRVEISLKPGQSIEPAWPFDHLITPHAATQLMAAVPVSSTAPETRTTVAAYMISPANERFAQVIVNRVWKRYMGAGLVEPAEDWDSAPSSHPELLQHLARYFVTSGYDLKALARLIVSSHLYQRAPVSEDLTRVPPSQRAFAGPMRRRMTAEQLVDSLYRAAGKSFDCEELNLNPLGNRPLKQFLNLGQPKRAWEFTALMNERDRPSLALPIAQSIVDVLTTYGWRQSRQNPITMRDDAPSPVQTLILANGIMPTRITRLSDDSAFTELAIQSPSLSQLVHNTFLRVLSRPPTPEELAISSELLASTFEDRIVPGAKKHHTKIGSDARVSWANHFDSESSAIRMEEERRLRLGTRPTDRLTPAFRESYEDLVWSLFNAPEFVVIP